MVDNFQEAPISHSPRIIDYDHILNPEGTLPKILLKQNKEISEQIKGYDILSDSSTKVGYIILAINTFKHERNLAYVGSIQIREEFRGKGFGKATYIEVLKSLNGIQLKSSTLNEKSRGIWEWLVRNGIPRKISDVEGGG